MLVTTGRHLIRKHIVILLVTEQENAIPNIIAGGCEVPFWCPGPFRFSISLFFNSLSSLSLHSKKIWSNSGRGNFVRFVPLGTHDQRYLKLVCEQIYSNEVVKVISQAFSVVIFLFSGKQVFHLCQAIRGRKPGTNPDLEWSLR